MPRHSATPSVGTVVGMLNVALLITFFVFTRQSAALTAMKITRAIALVIRASPPSEKNNANSKITLLSSNVPATGVRVLLLMRLNTHGA